MHPGASTCVPCARPLDEALEEMGAAAKESREPKPPPDLGEENPAVERLSRQLKVLHSALKRLASG